MGREVFSRWGFAFVLITIFLTMGTGRSGVPQASPAAADPGMARAFEGNIGQFQPDADFVLRMGGRRVLLDSARTVLVPLRSHAGRSGEATVLRFLGADPGATLEPIERLPGVVHYAAGADPGRWLTGAPTYAALVRRDLYSGIDLVYRGVGGRVGLEFEVAPEADPSSIVLDFGRLSTLTVDAASGDAVLEDGAGSLRLSRPVGASDGVTASWRPAGSTLSLIVSGRPASGALRIRTAIDLSAAPLAGSGALEAVTPSIATDPSGNVWVAGAVLAGPQTTPLGSLEGDPTGRGRGRTHGARGRLSTAYAADLAEVFVTRFDATGSTAEVTVFFGGAGDDTPRALVAAPDGRLVVVGSTTSADFPGAAPRSSRERDAFLLRLEPGGLRSLRSLVLGGSGIDEARACAADAAGNVWIAGRTSSRDFPVLGGPALSRAGGGSDAFVARIDGTGALVRAAVLGGSGQDEASGLALGEGGAIYVAGTSDSADFPSMNATQHALGGGTDAFVTRLDAAGAAVQFSTVLGGSGDETGGAIGLDASGDVVLVGTTTSSDFPIQRGVQPMRGGSAGRDAFLARLDVAGGALRYATYVGGAEDDRVSGMVLDPAGTAWLAGATLSERLGAIETVRLGPGGGSEAFSAGVGSEGTEQSRATLLAGDADDAATGIALGSDGRVLMVGLTASGGLPGTSRAKPSFSGDVFVARLEPQPEGPAGGVLCPDADDDFYAVCDGLCTLDAGDQCGDCDDQDFNIRPGALEQCNGVDDDCTDGVPANEADADGDGFRICLGDCNDGDASTYPGAPDPCNGIDENCLGDADSEADSDGDGFRLCQGDCNDASNTIYPGAPEQCNGGDDDCNGSIPANEADADGDGVHVCASDCNDANDTIYPGAPEVCDGLDNDCDGTVPGNEANADGDDFLICEGDCNDTHPGVFPGAVEVCNGLDDNCVGGVDEGNPGAGDECNTGQPGVCAAGTVACVSGELVCARNQEPLPAEQCNGLDDDCDGVLPANEVDGDGDGSPLCQDCNDANNTIHPGALEQCNGVDDDCSGAPHPIEADADGDGFRLCELDCDDQNAAVHPGAAETGAAGCSDGLDNDCDGNVDGQDGGCSGSGGGPTDCSTLGDQATGVIDEDVWTLTGSQGEALVVTLSASGGGGGRADLVLIDDMGTDVSQFQMDRTALPNEITVSLPATGPYRIVVKEHPPGLLLPGSPFRGAYCLAVQSAGSAAQTLAPTSSVEGPSTNR